MRILIATSHRTLVGGVERYLQSTIPGLLNRGHSVGLLHEDSFDKKRECIDPSEARLPSWCAQELGVATVLDSVAAWAPEVVYSHGLTDGSLEHALVSRYPVVLYQHTYNGTCISGRKCHAWPDLRPCSRRLGAACLLLYFPRRCGGLHPGTMRRMFREQTDRRGRFPRYQNILVASQHMREDIERHGAPSDRVRLVPLPMTSHLPAGAPPVAKLEQGRILFLGRLVDVKGVSHLIRALPEASKQLERPLTLTVAGDGSDREKVQRLASELQVKTDFAGWLDTEQKVDLLRRADLLVVPSLWPEPFGLVGIEAGRLGLPAVAYAVGGIPDWLVPGKSGELAPGDPPTVHGLAHAIVRALRDPEHYRKLCLGAWEVSKQFTLERHLNQLEPILADCAVPRSRESHIANPVL